MTKGTAFLTGTRMNTDLKHNGNYSDKPFQEGRFYHSRPKDCSELWQQVKE